MVTESKNNLPEESFPGVLIRITDPELQVYLQRYPFDFIFANHVLEHMYFSYDRAESFS